MNKQSETIQIAQALELMPELVKTLHFEAAAELMRLHLVNQELVEALERLEMTAGIPAMQDDPVRIKARAAIAKVKGESNE